MKNNILRRTKMFDEILECVICEGDIVMSARTGEKGVVHRTGVNYAIVVTEDGKMFREWVKDIRTINRP